MSLEEELPALSSDLATSVQAVLPHLLWHVAMTLALRHQHCLEFLMAVAFRRSSNQKEACVECPFAHMRDYEVHVRRFNAHAHTHTSLHSSLLSNAYGGMSCNVISCNVL